LEPPFAYRESWRFRWLLGLDARERACKQDFRRARRVRIDLVHGGMDALQFSELARA